MLNMKLKTITVVTSTALLAACASGGGTVPVAPATPVVQAPAAGAPAAGAPAAGAPAAGAPAATIAASAAAQCAANTLCGVDSVTLNILRNKPAVGATTVTGAAIAAAPTPFTATLDAAGNPNSITIGAGLPVALAPQQVGNNVFIGTAATGEAVELATYGSLVKGPVPAAPLGLTYSNFGTWVMKPVVRGAQTMPRTAWAGGTQLTTAMPTAGTATYAGNTVGSAVAVDAAGVWTEYKLKGTLSLTAAFAPTGGTINGTIAGVTAVDNNAVAPVTTAFNNVTLAGTINGNAFTGTATAGAAPVGVNPAAIAAGTVGTTNGHFYGPTANEVTGVWSMTTATVTAAGAFGAKQ